MHLRRQQTTILGLGLVIIVLALLNSLVFSFRLDLTENKAFTISPVTRDLLKGLPAPVRLEYYVSGKLRTQVAQIQGIADILQEYARASGGKVEVAILDTDGREDQLRPEDRGIQAQEYQVVEKNQVANTLVYTGIVISHLDKTATLPVVTDPADIEYELTTAIRSLTRATKPVLGILNGGSGQDMNSQYTMLSRLFQQQAEVRTLTPGEAIAADVSVLFVFGAERLSPIDLWNIDQFLMAGKGVLIGQDTVGVDLAANWQSVPLNVAAISRMLDAYGITLEKGWVFDDASRSLPFNQRSGQMTVQRLLPYPAWPAITGAGLNAANPLTGRSAGLDLFWASPVRLKEGIAGEVLTSSGPAAWLYTEGGSADPQTLIARHRMDRTQGSAGAVFPLAVLRSGIIESAYKDGPPASSKAVLSTGIKSTDKGRMVVVGDAEFASDLYQTLAQNGLVGNAPNIVFLKNAFEYLDNDQAMMELRTRQVWDTRLSAIADPAARDAVGTVALVVNAVVIPLGLVIFGLVRAIRRRRMQSQEQ